MLEGKATLSATKQAQARQAPSTLQPATDRAEVILRAAWLSIALGIVIQVVVLTFLLAAGSAGGVMGEIADAVERISWPLLVCVALAFAQTSGRVLGSTTLPATMGIVGFLGAPLAVTLARILHRGVSTALGGTSSVPSVEILLITGLLRAVQYGVLGAAVALIQRRPDCGPRRHALLGLVVGIMFGTAALGLKIIAGTAGSTARMIGDGLNELMLPVGCALILYATKALADRIKAS